MSDLREQELQATSLLAEGAIFLGLEQSRRYFHRSVIQYILDRSHRSVVHVEIAPCHLVARF